ncbi:hypothetical protein M899_1851 [Bacteriovorax sp. BSW11_IV]|uniref:Flp family type IVb pilin n=1 Tax=Bacteriovorax sp. BSW11_IV TaxID=1353529 RepID=UPI000389E0AC|nr:hypothetical protein [Bacteriovorax sp. BSW11_IV]EQC48448.1 hypothetical protein M899_1851 [Bacteriovorax sp. BSW11_IV]
MLNRARSKQIFKGQEGQTAVEYILLIGVVVILCLSMMKIVKERMVSTNCTGNNQSIVCGLMKIATPQNYKYFNISR